MLSISYMANAQVSFGKSSNICSGWKFILSDPEDARSVGFDDSKWEKIDLPYDWSVKGRLSPDLASCTGFLPGGTGWYRKQLHVSNDQQGRKLFLYFEGVYNRSEVYVNGNLVGKRPNGYISFMYDITPFVKYGEDNVIAVRVDHSRSADSRWYTGSGIYRNVFLIEAGLVHIAEWGVYVYPKTSISKQGILDIGIEIENESDENAALMVNNELISPDGKIVAKSSDKLSVQAKQNGKLTIKIKANNPELWNLEAPRLYTLKTAVVKDGKVIDETVTKTGFRTFSFDPGKGFALNGQWMKMKGVCLHHDAGVLGSAVPIEVWERRLKALKEIGCNAIRTSHNPESPDLYTLCDRLGILVLDEAFDEWEFPKRKWIDGWNTGIPGFDGSYDFFKEWGERDLADMVRRDRNHVSVFAWSIGNEVDYPNDPYSHPVLDGDGGFTQAMYGGYKKDAPDANRLGIIAKQLAKVVKKYDKSRPVTAGLAGVAMSNETGYPDALDIAGYNYTENRYDSDHKKYPERVIYGSETRHDIEAWKAVRDKKHIFGQFLWTGIDYLGESGRWPSRGFYSGLLDFGGFIKPRGHFRQSLWSDMPVAYLGTYPTPGRGVKGPMNDVWSQLDAEKNTGSLEEKIPSMDAWPVWNYQEGQLIRVVCYTNAVKAKLELNGKPVDKIKEYNDNTGIIYWDVPYEPGTLVVTGYDKKGAKESSYSVVSSEEPYALTVSSDKTTLGADKDLVHVVIGIVDKNGFPVMLSDNEITCEIIGPAKLLGLEAGNNSDMGDYTDNKQRVFNGRLLAYIQSTGEQGMVKIRFTSPWLKPAELDVPVK